ncbi:MAG: hypothetical protein R3B41_03660 [Candidatus Doudnabacteria bacterium]
MGDKGAEDLIAQFGSIENIYAALKNSKNIGQKLNLEPSNYLQKASKMQRAKQNASDYCDQRAHSNRHCGL